MRRVPSRLCRLLIALALLPQGAQAQPASAFDEVGRLYVQNFGPEDYDAHPQNWAVVQGPDGLVYVANGDGVLEYDGVSWRLIPVANLSRVRSLAVDDEGRVFVGAEGELGYLAPGSLGRMRYVSLVDHIPADDRKFGNIWRIEKTSDGLYFQTNQQLFRWNGREIEVWHPETRFLWVFAHQGSLYVQQDGIGLMRMVDDSLAMEPGGTFFQDRRLQGLVPLGEAEYLAITRNDGIFRCATARRSEVDCAPLRPNSTGVLAQRSAYRVAVLRNRILAIGTSRSGAFLVDEAGRLQRILNETSGLRTEEMHAVYPDRQDGLWLGLENGLARVEVSSPASQYGRAEGLLGAVVGAVRHQGRLYAVTSQGAFRLEPAAQGATPRFLPLSGFSTSCWSLLSTPQGLLVACKDGVHNLESNERFMEGAPCFVIYRSKRDKALLYVGLGGGLARLRLRDGRWRDAGRIHGIRDTVRSIVEDAEGRLWLGTGSAQVVRFDPERAASDAAAVSRFGTEQGLPRGEVSIASIAGRMVFWHRTGLLRFAGPDAGAVRFVPDTTFSAALAWQQSRLSQVVEDAQGRVWFIAGEASTVALPQPDGSYTFKPTALRRAPMGITYTAYAEDKGVLWVGGPHGLIRLDTTRSLDTSTSYPVWIRRITTSAGALLYDGKRNEPGTVSTWPYRSNALRISFAAPRQDAPERTRYRTRLDGLDRAATGDDWSAWTTESQRDFTNLWEGRYTFHVEARDVYGLVSREDTFSFRILPPWYRTWWAYTFYGLSLAAVALAYARWHRKKLQRERAMNARLREVDKLKDEFLANTSHELRTPLHGITGLAESLIDGAAGDVPEAVKTNLSMIVGSGRRLSQLVDDILDYSRLTHDSLTLRRRPVDLRPLTEVVLTLQKPLATGKDLELRNAVASDLPAADADEARLEQILHNLVGNAVKFTDEGSVVVSAAVKDQGSHGAEQAIVVAVEDTGIGVLEDKRERIFEAFEQGDSAVQRAFGGTGLGLTVTQKLVELHGGRIWLNSTVGQGTRFSFTLPISDQEAEPTSTTLQPVSGMMTAQPAAAVKGPALVDIPAAPVDTPAAARGKETSSILVVDDEAVNLQVLSNHLVSEGYDVTLATSGPQALGLAEERAFDLVMLDVMMPRMSGYEVCRELRQRYSLDDLPVIFLTAKNQVPDLVAGLDAGGNDYLAKPISKDELLARVRTHLELLSSHRQLARVVDDLETRNAELARFNYTVAHDLKNPLTTILNFLGLARRDVASGQTERLESDLDCLTDAAQELRQLLDELFELSRVGIQANPPEEVAFGDLVHNALAELAGPIAERGVEVELATDLPAVTGDRSQLQEALRHLLDNAVKYLGDETSPCIAVGVRETKTPKGDPPTFYVRDNGIGIDPRYHEKVFGLFERLDPETSAGTGIGLALVKRIVEVHKGRIWIESGGQGRGSTFCFKLPAKPASPG